MDIAKIEKQIKLLQKAKDNALYEKKQLMQDYEKLKDIVIRSGIVALISALFQAITVGGFLNSKSVVLLGLGRYLTPFVITICMVSMIIFILKGFDLFINADTEWSKKLAEKLEKGTYTDKITSLNNSIIRIDIELEKLENVLDGDSDEMFNKLDFLETSTIKEEASGLVDKKNKKIVKKESEKEIKSEINKDLKKEESIDDILSALDNWELDDEDDDFENSSEMWKRDSKGLG